MRLVVKKSQVVTWIECLPIVLFCTWSSLGMLFSRRIHFALVILLGIFVLLSCDVRKIPKNLKFLYVLVMMFLYFWNNAYLSINRMSYLQRLFCFPVFFLFALQGGYRRKEWIKITFTMLRWVYLVYVIWTILSVSNWEFVEYTCRLFPEYAGQIWNQYSRGGIAGLTHHYSTNGMLISVGTMIYGAYALCYKRGIDKYLFFNSVVALLLTGKRAHVLFGMGGLYVAYYVYNSGKKKGKFFKSIGMLLIAAIVFAIASSLFPALATVVNRFIDSVEAGDTTMGRTAVWLKALTYVPNYLILGMGWEQYAASGGWTWNLHNIYLQLLLETGLIGFLLYVGWFGFMLVRTWKTLAFIRCNRSHFLLQDSCMMCFALGMQVLFLLYGFTGNPLYDREMYGPYFLACAISNRYTKDITNYENQRHNSVKHE